MANIQTIHLSGLDEMMNIPQEGLNIVLPMESENCSSMVTIERIAGNKWAAPQNMIKLVTSNAKYIAYTVEVKGQHMIKVITLDNSCKTVIKGISGCVYDVMFKDVNQDTLAILSCDEGSLNLYVYSILVNNKDKLDHELVLSHMFDLIDTTRPILAFQPSDDDVTFLGLGVNTTLYTVQLNDDEKVVNEYALKHTAAITGMNIANDTAGIVATCSEDGSVIFYNTSKDEELLNWKPFSNSTEPVLWITFADNHLDPEAQSWRYMLVANTSSIAIISCEHWTINHSISIIGNGVPLSKDDIRYQLDSTGRFLILTPLLSPFLYIIELDTEGDCGYFTQLACYPLAKSLYDVTVMRVMTEEPVQSRFNDGSVKHNLHLIGVNNQAIQGMNAIFDKSYKPLNTSHSSNILNNSLSSIKGLSATSSIKGGMSASSSVKGMSASSSVKSINTSSHPTDQAPPVLLGPSAFSSTSSIPTEYAPLSVPVSQPFPILPHTSTDLMPTPLPTPDTAVDPVFLSEDTTSDPIFHSEDTTSDGVDVYVFRICEDPAILSVLHSVYIRQCDQAGVNEFEADLISFLAGLDSVEDDEFSNAFIEFYTKSNLETGGHIREEGGHNVEAVLAQIFSKYLIIHSYNCAAAVVTINKSLRNTSFTQNFNIMLCESISEFLINYRKDVFDNLQTMVRQLYNSETFKQHDMLILLEKLVKSHFECQSEDPQLSGVWSELVISNLVILVKDITVKDGTDKLFIEKVRNVLDPFESMPQISEVLQALHPAQIRNDPDLFSLLTRSVETPGGASYPAPYQPSDTYQTSPTLERSSSILMGMLKNSSSQPSLGLPQTHQSQDIQANMDDLLEHLERGPEQRGTDVFLDIARNIVSGLPESMEDIATKVVHNYYAMDWFVPLAESMATVNTSTLHCFRLSLAKLINESSGDNTKLLVEKYLQLGRVKDLTANLRLLNGVYIDQETCRDFVLQKIQEIIDKEDSFDKLIFTDLVLTPQIQQYITSLRVAQPQKESDIDSNVESTKSNNGYSSDYSEPSETKSSELSTNDDNRPVSYPAQDVRYKNQPEYKPFIKKTPNKKEKHRLSSIDELQKVTTNLKKNIEELKQIQPPRQRETKDIAKTVRDRLTKPGGGQNKQINSCVDSFYTCVLRNLDKDIERWFEEVVQHFRTNFTESFGNKQKKLTFKVDQKELDKSVCNMVNVVRGTVSESISNAMVDYDLKEEIEQTIIPSFQAMLGQTFKQIEASVCREFSLHSTTLSQMKGSQRQDEQALLDQLDMIERSVVQLETLKIQRSELINQELGRMEERLNSCVTDLYKRHDLIR